MDKKAYAWGIRRMRRENLGLLAGTIALAAMPVFLILFQSMIFIFGYSVCALVWLGWVWRVATRRRTSRKLVGAALILNGLVFIGSALAACLGWPQP